MERSKRLEKEKNYLKSRNKFKSKNPDTKESGLVFKIFVIDFYSHIQRYSKYAVNSQ